MALPLPPMTSGSGLSLFAANSGAIGRVLSVGPLRAAPLAVVLEEERREAEITQAQPMIGQLAQHVQKAWMSAWDAKRNTVEERLLKCIRARRGEYDPDKLAAIREQGGSDAYAMLTSVKCRAAASWIRDILLTNGTEKPWTIRPTPVPELSPAMNQYIVDRVTDMIAQANMLGQMVSDEEVGVALGKMRDHTLAKIRDQARLMAERMESKMEDQLIEGGFVNAMHQFVDDIVTFPAAILKGPIVRNKNQLKWLRTPNGDYVPEIQKDVKLEWERVSPFDIYPSPESEGINDGYLIEKHRLSRSDLNDLIGVEGYDDASIRMVLDLYGRGGLRNWLYDDVGRAAAEGKSAVDVLTNPDHLIDAIQYWGSVQGKLLVEWGVPKDQVPDETAEYSVEAWLIGPYIIKATLNHHPLGEKPYYKASYEEIPGSFWGNSPPDLIRDAQTVVNAATRALVNNMGLASGPQVVVNVDRLAAGEDVEQLRPWRIWQTINDTMGVGGNTTPPIMFSQPQSNIPELSGVITRFMDLADEWSGIPKYLTGDSPGGAGRTASGLSMLMSNAGKSLKQVIANIDNSVLKPMLYRLYYFNMRYGSDPDLKGDISIVVRGANALVAKETAQVRRSEFLAATANPVDMQIVGLEGRAQVLRETAKALDMDVDKIVPPPEVIKLKQAAAQQQLMLQAQMQGSPKSAATPAAQGPTPAAPGGPSDTGQSLMDNSPQVDNFSPPRQ